MSTVRSILFRRQLHILQALTNDGLWVQNVNVHLEKGAILDFSTNESDYLPAVITRWEGTELFNYSPLIYAYHVQNIALTGEGTVNGNGSKKFSPWNNIQTVEQEMLR